MQHGDPPAYGPAGGPIVDQAPGPGPAPAPAPGAMAQAAPAVHPPGVLEVEMKFFPLAWLLYFFSPRVEINGQRHPAKWGLNRFDLPANQYQLRCYFPYIFGDTCPAHTVASVYVGHTTRIRYDVPLILLGSGKIREVGVVPSGPPGLTPPR